MAFLHAWADDSPKTLDKQILHWMKELSNKGTIKETLAAPRHRESGTNTKYTDAKDILKEYSKKTIFFERDVSMLTGVVNTNGVYLNGIGYYIWES